MQLPTQQFLSLMLTIIPGHEVQAIDELLLSSRLELIHYIFTGDANPNTEYSLIQRWPCYQTL